MRCLLASAVLLCAACSPPTHRMPGASQDAKGDAVREAVLRAIAQADTRLYFKAYCVAVVAGEVPALQGDEARVGTAAGAHHPDASDVLLSRLRDMPHRFLPASECAEDTDGDIVVRSRGRGPALLVTVGRIQVVSDDRREVVVFTTSGDLTETVTAFQLGRTADGGWKVLHEGILLQA